MWLNLIHTHLGNQCSSNITNLSVHTDIDECRGSHTCSHGCINSYGSYDCVCPPGYQLEAPGADGCIGKSSMECGYKLCDLVLVLIVCGLYIRVVLIKDLIAFTDIDECFQGACSDIEGSTCMNTEGSYECQCRAGYRLSSDQQTCEGTYISYR